MNDFVIHMADLFKALGDPTRLKILRMIATKKNDLYVAEIAKKLSISVSAVSQHFKVLKSVKLVKPQRNGFHMYYQVNNDLFDSFKSNIDKLMGLVFISCDFDGPCSKCPKEKDCRIK